MHKIHKDKQGVVLAFALFAVIFLVLIVAAIFITINILYSQTHKLVESEKAYYIAQAGAQRGLFLISNGDYPDLDTETKSLCDGTALISITDDGTYYTISSSGTFKQQTRNITLISDETGGILSWD